MIDPQSSMLTADALTMFNHARDKRRPIIGKWITNYQVIHNKTWSKYRSPGHPRTEIPEIYPILASIVAWMTDQKPRYRVSAMVPPDSPVVNFYAGLSSDLEWILNANWEALDYHVEAAQILWDGELYGIAYGKTYWDSESSDGLGDVQMRRCDPFQIYLDPDASSWKDISYIVETKQMTQDEVKRRFPRAKVDELGFSDYGTQAPNQMDQSGGSRGVRPNPGRLPKTPDVGTNVTTFGGKGERPSIMDGTVTLMEMWYRTTAKSNLPEAPTPDPTPETPNRSKTKDQWHCLIWAGNQILLHKKAEDVMGANMHPYARYCPLEEGELYGYSLVEQLAPIQISINRLFASIEHNAWLAGNPILVRRDGSKAPITNRPGEVVEVDSPNQDVRWLEPPKITQEHFMAIDRLIEEMERVSGMSAIVRGSQPQGRPSEGVVNTVQDSAFVRIRQRLRNFERFLREMGILQAHLVTQFYDQERVMSRIGDDGQGSALKIMDLHFYTLNKEGLEPFKFNMNVTAGSSDSIGREARNSMYERLFAVGALNVPTLLKLMNVPGWHQIAEEVQAEQAAAGTMGQPPTQRAAARR